ncbi:2,3-bisphosphoglycerate-independent phosphoglycerate mutase [Anncaliia algerae PRA339]|uniref:phosphoglycerate mutase (2,3-diphosphoglycerate-independent) n=1 Tax=Anncaliia algerae PRA339 TaxID=1288291 RepID=A0A059EYN2_9MICR|nr:2,3-bisphosphoglycerate-independent phosphoglycerate mutase [Anncaliia algerae PRA339]
MRKTLLVILDGFGYTTKLKHKNPLFTAKLPFLKRQSKNGILIYAHGEHVGLQPDQMGNSEVGHLTIGAGRIILQDIMRINKVIEENALVNYLNEAKVFENDTIHFVGLLSDGGIHSHILHLKALIKECNSRIKNIYIHCIADGRDTAPRSFEKYFTDIENFCKGTSAKIASVSGRYFSMDRNENTERIEESYKMMTGDKEGIINYEVSVDENIKPVLLLKEGSIKKEDSVFFFNFRADRMKQIVRRFMKEHKNIYTMMVYDEEFQVTPLFKKEKVEKCLAQVIATKLNQCHIAETEKFAHVTYFLNGNEIIPFENEKREIVESPRVKNYEHTPEMSTRQVGEKIIKEIQNNTPFIVSNIASPDMIGHTGNYSATCRALEITDEVLSMVYDECKKNEYTMVITADHGNCEEMFDDKGGVATKHTKNKVPFIICSDVTNDDWSFKDTEYGLSDVAPTILELLSLEQPKEMTGKSLLKILK